MMGGARVVTQADIRRKASVFLIVNSVERRRPYPGQRYRHGWIPVTPGVRGALMRAISVEEIGGAAEAEALRITGRDISFNFEGSDPQIAREHAEGVLRALERFPGAPLERVQMEPVPPDTDPEAPPTGMMAYAHQPFDARTALAPPTEITEISFALAWAANPEAYRAAIKAKNEKTLRSPIHVGIHEMGHVVAFAADAEDAAYRVVARHRRRRVAAGQRGLTTRELVRRELSRYATTAEQEFVAEAFTDVLVNGDEASALSREAFEVIEERFKAGVG